MPEILKTPGVYIVEKDSGANAVVQVATAVPVFIGYTERAEVNGKSFHMKPVHITSLSEFDIFFGGAPIPVFSIKTTTDSLAPGRVLMHGTNYILEQSPNTSFMLYSSLKLFFDNGGADCYIISIGQYGSVSNVSNSQESGDDKEKSKDSKVKNTNEPLEITPDAFKKAIDLLAGEEVPTMLLMPDSLLLNEEDSSYYSVQTYALAHCAKYMNKVAIFDIWGANSELPPEEDKNKYITRFRENIGLENLTYGAAYYPWIKTNIVPMSNIGYENFDLASLAPVLLDAHKPLLDKIQSTTENKEKRYWDAGLKSASQEYKLLRKIVADKINVLPVAPAMAGLYTRTDKARGVWVAPANQNLNSAIAPAVKITHEDQESLNVDTLSGKSINAIRAFKGRGSSIVWGARTLAGNSVEWKYVNVRRLFILVEQSIKNAAFSVVFKPNVSITWAVVKGTITSFLSTLWRQGALVGATAADAFEVKCGLDSTMTPDDVNAGIMRIQVKMAPSRPAEFIVITFEQKMNDKAE